MLDLAVDDAAARLVAGTALPLAALRGEPAALRRLLLRRMAEPAAGKERPLRREDCDRILALGDAGGTRELDLGEGLRAVVEYGTLRFALGADAPPPDPVELPVPGAARFGSWEVEARLGEEGEACVSAETLGSLATVRAWRDGDRMRPPGPRAAPRRSRTCSPTARCRARCAARCRWWRRAARSSGWPAWPSTSASRRRPGAGRRGPERP